MIIIIICLIISTFCYFSLPLDIGYKASLALAVFMMALELFVMFKRKEQYELLKNQYLRIFPILTFSFVCVHFQQFIDIFLGFGNFYYPEYSNEFLVLKGAFLSLMGLSSLLLGYSYASNKTSTRIVKVNKVEYNHFWMRTIFNYLFLGFVVLFVILNGRAYLSGNYSQEMMLGMQGSLNAYSIIFMQCCMYAVTIESCKCILMRNQICSLGTYVRGFSPIYYICLVTVLFFNLFLGDRGPLITYICIYIYGYIIVSKRKINIVTIVAVAFTFAILLSIISIYRNDENKSFSNFQNYRNEVAAKESISPFTAELAGSTYPTLLAIESTPDTYPYRYGIFSLNNILSVIPFSSSILRVLGLNSSILLFSHSSSFITWYGHGGDMTRSGIGSSTVADVYLDFGPVGVIVILLFLGIIVRILDERSFTSDLCNIGDFWLIAAFVMFAHAIYFPRSMVFFFIKDIVWTWIFYKMSCCIFGRFKS
mgnify:CR=1 FL=1